MFSITKRTQKMVAATRIELARLNLSEFPLLQSTQPEGQTHKESVARDIVIFAFIAVGVQLVIYSNHEKRYYVYPNGPDS